MRMHKGLYSAILTAAGITLAAAPLASQAADSLSSGSTASAPAISTIVQSNNEVGLGLLGAYSNFKQSDGALSLNGWMPGGAAYVKAMRNLAGIQHWYFSLHDQYSQGTTHQSGGASDSGYEHQNEAYLRLGKGFALAPQMMLTPYIQYGYQYQNRNLGGGEHFSLRNQLAGVGLLAQYAYTPRLVLSANVNVDGTINPELDAHSVDTSSHTRLGTRAIEQVSLGADYRLSGHFHTFAKVGYGHRDYGHSGPDLHQNNAYAETGVAYSW